MKLKFQVTENVDYDRKIGYKLRAPSVRDSGIYNCEANRNDFNEARSLSVKINRELVLLLTWCVVWLLNVLVNTYIYIYITYYNLNFCFFGY